MAKTPQFKDEKYMSAREKLTVFHAWRRFIQGGFQRKHFTKALYTFLHMHCGFMAHFDADGFYGTYFERPEDTERFVRQFDRGAQREPAEGPWPRWWGPWCEDLSLAMIDAATPLAQGIYAMLTAQSVASIDDLVPTQVAAAE